MATQQLVVRIVGDSKNLQTEFAKGSQAAKKFSASVSESAQKSVASTVRQTERLRQLQAEYTRVARSATAGSAEQAAAAKLAADASRRLERTTASTTRELDRSGRSFRFFGTNVDRGARGILVGSGALGRLGRAATFASTAFVGGAGITFAIRSSSAAASNLAEQSAKAAVVFGRSANIVQDFARNSLGLATDEALASAAAFGALLRPLGITERAAATTSTRLVQLALDLSSFSNVPVADSLQAIQSGLVGEVEPLRRFGILLSEARVQQEALAETGKRSVKQLTNQEKVQARLTLIFRDSAQAQGDFARTQGGLANQQRILQANIRDLEGAIGTGLNPAILDTTKRLNVWLGDTENQKRVQRDVSEAVRISTTIIRDFAAVIDRAASAVGGFKNLIEGLVALKLATVFAGWSRSLTALGASAGEAGAAGQIGLLLSRMGILSSAGPIVATVIIAEQTRRDPHSILDRLDFLSKHSNLLENVPNLGPLAQAFGLEERNRRVQKFLHDLKLQTIGPTGELRGALPEARFHKPTFARIIGGTRPGGGGGDEAGLTPEERARRIALRNTIFENFIGRRRDRIADIQSLRGQAAALVGIARSIEAEILRVHDTTRKLTLGDDLASVMRQRRGILEQIAEDSRQASKDAQEEAKRAREDAKRAAEEAAANALRLRNALQFKALGLGPTGDTIIPPIRALRKELERLTKGIDGTILDNKRTASLISRIRKVLSGGLGALSGDVRTKVAELLGNLDQQLKNHASKANSTKFRVASVDALLGGLGLDRDTIKALRQRFARVGPGLTVPQSGRAGAFGVAVPVTVVHTSVSLDGEVVARNTTRHQQKRNRSAATQTTGPHAGNGSGFVH